MRFTVNAWENLHLFGPEPEQLDERPWHFDTPAHQAWALAQPHRLVATFEVEAESAADVPDKVYEIGNAPWNPEDVNGQEWPHTSARSQCEGDSVVVYTPDGPVGYTVMSVGFKTFQPPQIVVDKRFPIR